MNATIPAKIAALAAFLLGNAAAFSPEIFAENVNEILAKEREKREAEARENSFAGTKDTLSISVSASYLFDLHSAVSHGKGGGISASLLAHFVPEDAQELNFLGGAEIFSFYAEAKKSVGTAHLFSANLVLTGGFSYEFSKNFSAGILLGYGIFGAAAFSEHEENGHRSSSGTMPSILSARPFVEISFSKNLSFFAAYKFFYMAPSLFSKLANWGEIETAASALEVGILYKF